MEKKIREGFSWISLNVVREKSNEYLTAITHPNEAAELIRPDLENSDREKFVTIMLDSKNRAIAANVVSIGTLNASLVHPREVFKAAILSNAASIILAHNHPSGEPGPSIEDIDLTKRLVEAGDILGIPVRDHIIIGSGGSYKSFLENSLI
jgi:DNA repair protein RadC